jgi:hypothetical protein
MPGISCAPIENSPPGIHTMPSGAPAGGRAALGTVAVNRVSLEGTADQGGGTGAPFETGVPGRVYAAHPAIPAKRMAPAINGMKGNDWALGFGRRREVLAFFMTDSAPSRKGHARSFGRRHRQSRRFCAVIQPVETSPPYTVNGGRDHSPNAVVTTAQRQDRSPGEKECGAEPEPAPGLLSSVILLTALATIAVFVAKRKGTPDGVPLLEAQTLEPPSS